MHKVFIIEDEVLLRDLLCEVISNQIDLTVIGTSGDGREGMNQCLKLRPDLLITDVQLPSLNGIEIVERLKSEMPALRILVISGLFNLARIKRILMLRVDGILEKAAGLAEMERGLKAVASGQTYYSPEIMNRMPELLATNPNEGGLENLTSREREVLQLIAEGLTNKEVADRLHISVRTADVHRTHLMQKLSVHNVAGLTRAAIRFGLIEADSP